MMVKLKCSFFGVIVAFGFSTFTNWVYQKYAGAFGFASDKSVYSFSYVAYFS